MLSQPKCDKLKLSCQKKTRCLVNNNGFKDDKVKLEGVPNQVVPQPTFFEPSEQNVVDCTIPEEWHIDIVEEPNQLGNDTELVDNEEQKRNIFDSADEVLRGERNVLFVFIDELVLEPQ